MTAMKVPWILAILDEILASSGENFEFEENDLNQLLALRNVYDECFRLPL